MHTDQTHTGTHTLGFSDRGSYDGSESHITNNTNYGSMQSFRTYTLLYADNEKNKYLASRALRALATAS